MHLHLHFMQKKMDQPSRTHHTKQFVNLGGKLLDLSTPRVMGILNLTPDSFYDGGKYYDQPEAAVARTREMLSEGASIIDIGACSTRPGAVDIGYEEESRRLYPVLEAIRASNPEAILSVDTYRAKVAHEVVSKYNVQLINDISSGSMDLDMTRTIIELGIPYVITHIQGRPEDMHNQCTYNVLIEDIAGMLSEKVEFFRSRGHKDIIIDPGFGFGKTVEQNHELARNLEYLQWIDCPVLVGVSRKSMLWKPLECSPEDTLAATSAMHMILLQKGASILRVHDVKEAVQVIRLHELYKKSREYN
jgi:dihydropteroate synthase